MSAIQFESIKKKTLQPLFWCRSCGIEGPWLSNHTTSKWLNRDLAQPLILSDPSILQPFLFSPTSILRHLECSLCLVIYLLKAWYCLGKYSPLVGKTFPQSGLASTAMSPSVLALNPQLNVNGPTDIRCSRLSSSQGYSSFPIPAFRLHHPVSLLGNQLVPQHAPGSLSWPLLPASSASCASSLEPGVKPGVDSHLCRWKTMPSGWAVQPI